MLNILFVCLGNICRSPIAHGVLEAKIKSLNLTGKINVDSAGTSSWHRGEHPDPGSIDVCRKYGLDITGQKSRPVSTKDTEQFNYFIAMDKSNYWTLKNEYAIPDERLFLMRDFDPNKDGNRDVPDPYGMSDSAFEDVYKMIDRSMDGFLEFLKEKHPDIFRG